MKLEFSTEVDWDEVLSEIDHMVVALVLQNQFVNKKGKKYITYQILGEKEGILTGILNGLKELEIKDNKSNIQVASNLIKTLIYLTQTENKVNFLHLFGLPVGNKLGIMIKNLMVIWKMENIQLEKYELSWNETKDKILFQTTDKTLQIYF